MTRLLRSIMDDMDEVALYGTLVRGIKAKYPGGAWVEPLWKSLKGTNEDYLSLPAVRELHRSWNSNAYESLKGVSPAKAIIIEEAVDLWSRSKEARS